MCAALRFSWINLQPSASGSSVGSQSAFHCAASCTRQRSHFACSLRVRANTANRYARSGLERTRCRCRERGLSEPVHPEPPRRDLDSLPINALPCRHLPDQPLSRSIDLDRKSTGRSLHVPRGDVPRYLSIGVRFAKFQLSVVCMSCQEKSAPLIGRLRSASTSMPSHFSNIATNF
jgi:hypothetical protein